MSGGGLVRGKVTREVLERVFGDLLLKALDDYQRSRVEKRKSLRRAGTAGSTANRSGGDGNDYDDHGDDDDHLEVLCGTQDSPGKLQVCLCVSSSNVCVSCYCVYCHNPKCVSYFCVYHIL